MSDPKLVTEFQPGRGYSKEDWDDVSDSPEWTEEDFKNARPFAEVFPEFAEALRREEVLVAGDPGRNTVVALEKEIVQKFKEQGSDWRQRINDTLRKAVGL